MQRPQIGETRTYANRKGARTYVVLGAEQVFSNRRGRVVDLIVWEGTCRQCAARFRTATGISRREVERGPQIVHCEEHRR
jgi:hypothetical protein